MMKRGTSFTKMIEDSKHLIKGSNWGLMENLSKLINVHNNIRSQNVILHRSGHHHQSHIANRTYSYTVRVIREMGNYLYSPFNPSHLRALGMARPLALLTHHEHTHPLPSTGCMSINTQSKAAMSVAIAPLHVPHLYLVP